MFRWLHNYFTNKIVQFTECFMLYAESIKHNMQITYTQLQMYKHKLIQQIIRELQTHRKSKNECIICFDGRSNKKLFNILRKWWQTYWMSRKDFIRIKFYFHQSINFEISLIMCYKMNIFLLRVFHFFLSVFLTNVLKLCNFRKESLIVLSFFSSLKINPECFCY